MSLYNHLFFVSLFFQFFTFLFCNFFKSFIKIFILIFLFFHFTIFLSSYRYILQMYFLHIFLYFLQIIVLSFFSIANVLDTYVVFISGHSDQFSYQPSLLNAPDLPSWIHYTYSKKDHHGFLYGVAPKDQKYFQVIAQSLYYQFVCN